MTGTLVKRRRLAIVLLAILAACWLVGCGLMIAGTSKFWVAIGGLLSLLGVCVALALEYLATTIVRGGPDSEQQSKWSRERPFRIGWLGGYTTLWAIHFCDDWPVAIQIPAIAIAVAGLLAVFWMITHLLSLYHPTKRI